MFFDLCAPRQTRVNNGATFDWLCQFDDACFAMSPFNDETQHRLLAQKSSLDRLCDTPDKAKKYRAVRNALYPLHPMKRQTGIKRTMYDRSRSNTTRAGCKLDDILTILFGSVGMPNAFTQLQVGSPAFFLDVCGGPGAFTLVLMDRIRTHGLVPRGWGITLATQSAASAVDWFHDLRMCTNFHPLEGGEFENGDITNPVIIHAVVKHVIRTTDQLLLIVCDGGFELCDTDPSRENYQELYTMRLIFAQVALALQTLGQHGTLICKFFNMITWPIFELVVELASCFRRTFVIKPTSSRAINSERYLVCTDYVGFNSECVVPCVERLMYILSTWHVNCVPTALFMAPMKAPVLFEYYGSQFVHSYQPMLQTPSNEQANCIGRIAHVLNTLTECTYMRCIVCMIHPTLQTGKRL